MGEIIGIGCPHGPHMRFTDETMANNYFRVNLLDENFPDDQRVLLQKWGIRVRQIGRDIGAAGIDDEAIIPLLHEIRGVTFFTHDSTTGADTNSMPMAVAYSGCTSSSGIRERAAG